MGHNFIPANSHAPCMSLTPVDLKYVSIASVQANFSHLTDKCELVCDLNPLNENSIYPILARNTPEHAKSV